jgi:Kef-type K+ transport system membrane component KefB
MDAILLVVLAGLMEAVQSFRGGAGTQVGTSLGFGYLLLTAHLAGRLFDRIRLPRLTGYIAAGAVVGPSLLGLVTPEVIGNLRVFNGTAVALIALAAGTELRFERVRPLLRTVAWTTALAVGASALVLAAAVYALRGTIPFLAALDAGPAAALALVVGTVLVAKSPAVVVALGGELRADGPVTRVVLAAVVLGDLAVILLFAVVSALAKAALGTGADASAVLRQISWETLGSFAGGLALAGVLALHLRFVRRGSTLFVLAAAIVVAEVAPRLDLDVLLVALSAGVAVRNGAGLGDALHARTVVAALPVYVTFFALTGAALHLDALPPIALAVAALVGVRAATLLAAGHLGARIAGAPPVVARWAPFGLLPQAGLALALAALLGRAFPELGPETAALVLGVVTVNEIVSPALYRLALVRSGEAGALPPDGLVAEPRAGTPLPVAGHGGGYEPSAPPSGRGRS